jgi:ribosome-associated toxin RatA of RatAB toxin-antitoxin module
MNDTNDASFPMIDQRSAFESSGSALLTRRAWISCLSVLAVPSVALAAPQNRNVERYERAIAGSSQRAGAARTGVDASAQRVEAVVTDYAGYARFIDQFERARVVGRGKTSTDLYIEIPILHGLTKIWAVLRFQAPVRNAGSTVVAGRMLKGNVNRLDVTWRVDRVDASSTRLAAELVLDISLPAPESAVMKTVKRAAAQAVKGARKEAEAARG